MKTENKTKIFAAPAPQAESSIHSIKVVDGFNYNLMNSYQTKHLVNDLSCDMQDNHLAIIEVIWFFVCFSFSLKL